MRAVSFFSSELLVSQGADDFQAGGLAGWEDGGNDADEETDGDGDATALTLYASLQATEKLSLHLRGEYAETDTTLLGGTGNLSGGNSKFLALTTTLQYDLWNNVISRLEVRWDHQAGDGDMIGYGGAPAYSGGGGAGSISSGQTKRNNVLIAANFIYAF